MNNLYGIPFRFEMKICNRSYTVKAFNFREIIRCEGNNLKVVLNELLVRISLKCPLLRDIEVVGHAVGTTGSKHKESSWATARVTFSNHHISWAGEVRRKNKDILLIPDLILSAFIRGLKRIPRDESLPKSKAS